MTALLSGAIEMGGLNVASGRKHIESGDLKGFAIAAAERSKHLPDMPTLKELGIDMIYALDRGIVAPKGTPRDVIDHWSAIFKKAAADPGLRKANGRQGYRRELGRTGRIPRLGRQGLRRPRESGDQDRLVEEVTADA